MVVNNLNVATGTPYTLAGPFTDCCANSHGRDWIDYPYVLQSNLGGSPSEVFYIIKTAIADTSASNDPLITFRVRNRCARVEVIFADEDDGPFDCPPQTDHKYPSWIASSGFSCSVTCGGTVAGFHHETLGSGDQIAGAYCFKTFMPGSNVMLGPRVPDYANAKMYTVVVSTDTCP